MRERNVVVEEFAGENSFLAGTEVSDPAVAVVSVDGYHSFDGCTRVFDVNGIDDLGGFICGGRWSHVVRCGQCQSVVE